FSPSPITTVPSMLTLERTLRIAAPAAPSAASLSPRPTHGPAAMAAASVTRTSSSARLRSGAPSWIRRLSDQESVTATGGALRSTRPEAEGTLGESESGVSAEDGAGLLSAMPLIVPLGGPDDAGTADWSPPAGAGTLCA